MDTLNIALITTEYIPARGGTSTYLINLSRNLAQMGMNVHILTPRRMILGGNADTPFGKDLQYVMLNRGVTIHEIGSSQGDFGSQLRFQAKVPRIFAKLDSEIHFDIVHSNFPHMPDMLLLMSRAKTLPMVSTVHTSVKVLMETTRSALHLGGVLDEAGRSFTRYYYPLRIAETAYLCRMPNLIAVSRFVQDRILGNKNAQKTHLVYLGVDENLFKFRPTRDSINSDLLKVLFVSRFAAHKGIHVLLRAIPDVVRQYPEVKFVFVGGSADAWILESLANLRVKPKNYEFRGYVNNYFELPSVYDGDVFVSPSFEDSLGIRLLEAMSIGIPVIATGIGGVPEIIENYKTGILVNPGDIKGLVSSIIDLINDSVLRRTIAFNARDNVATRFNTRRMAEETLKVYRSILEG